jgi:hypothetical protein
MRGPSLFRQQKANKGIRPLFARCFFLSRSRMACRANPVVVFAAIALYFVVFR